MLDVNVYHVCEVLIGGDLKTCSSSGELWHSTGDTDITRPLVFGDCAA